MFILREGNILDSDAEILTNTVNCVGVMSKGIALQFKQRYPEMFADYVIRCKRGEVRPGAPYLYGRILNFPTKDHWKQPSKLEWIDSGLEWLSQQEFESIAIPPLGCGLGGLRWPDVVALIKRHLSDSTMEIHVYAPVTPR